MGIKLERVVLALSQMNLSDNSERRAWKNLPRDLCIRVKGPGLNGPFQPGTAFALAVGGISEVLACRGTPPLNSIPRPQNGGLHNRLCRIRVSLSRVGVCSTCRRAHVSGTSDHRILQRWKRLP